MDILASVAPRAMSRRQRRRFAANARAAIDAPDNLRKVACCPKCRGWFPSTEIRNAHRAEEHKGSTNVEA